MISSTLLIATSWICPPTTFVTWVLPDTKLQVEAQVKFPAQEFTIEFKNLARKPPRTLYASPLSDATIQNHTFSIENQF